MLIAKSAISHIGVDELRRVTERWFKNDPNMSPELVERIDDLIDEIDHLRSHEEDRSEKLYSWEG